MNADGPLLTVVVTGAFGNVGDGTVRALLAARHKVTAYDLPTPRNRLALRRHGIDVAWGDVTDRAAVTAAVSHADAAVHLAALIPPRSDRKPDLARRVHVDGSRRAHRRPLIRPTAPLVRRAMLRRSPYWQEAARAMAP